MIHVEVCFLGYPVWCTIFMCSNIYSSADDDKTLYAQVQIFKRFFKNLTKQTPKNPDMTVEDGLTILKKINYRLQNSNQG